MTCHYIRLSMLCRIIKYFCAEFMCSLGGNLDALNLQTMQEKEKFKGSIEVLARNEGNIRSNMIKNTKGTKCIMLSERNKI